MDYKAAGTADHFLVTGDSGSVYEVNILSKSCTCPQYRIRLKGNGTCKHYTFLISQLQGLPAFQNVNKEAQQLLKRIKENGGLADTDIREGDDSLLSQLEKEGEIFYDRKKHKYIVLE